MDIWKVIGIFKVIGLESYYRCCVVRSILCKMFMVVMCLRLFLGFVVKYIYI